MVEPRFAEVSSETLNAASVVLGGRAVLIESRDSGARSEFALRLIDRGGRLIAGDQTVCQRQGSDLIACAPAESQGQIDVPAMGIVTLPVTERAPVSLLVVLLDTPPRFPEPAKRRLAGIDVPVLALGAGDVAAPIKVGIALGQFGE
ncbi:HPr kinase/phosphorylase [Sphingomonas sp. S2-65]|uniref:HPr kinase/phosphorylase n=1 Tax=Sphingomonas sp. S2-65 TaxID=2903960 RepID=UPI001F31D3E6|nr:aldolase [Sphingomonas sp. S2-65]UYY59115.1 aldolase [Sphingomonas sp. S2-65]